MIERHITFDVHPAMTAEFVRFFTDEYRPPVSRYARAHRVLPAPRGGAAQTRYQMVFRWEAAEQAVAWRVSEVHQGLQPALHALHAGMEIVAYTKVA